MTAIERFLKYVSYPTSSGKDRVGKCSTDSQYVLGKLLMEELNELGLTDIKMNDYGIVSATLGGELEPTFALLAHMDTSPSAKGDDIKPRLIKDYDGEAIELNPSRLMSPAEFPTLQNKKGHDLIVTDGNTLLGADDKAGIAIIMAAIEEVIKSKAPHHTIEVVFTTDEEIGTGVDHVERDALKSKFGYTVDGGSSHLVNKSNFNAINMEVEVLGRSVHPGTAYHKMINAISYAILFDRSLPTFERPEFTKDREGFFHLNDISGNEERTTLSYIIRDFSKEDMKHRVFIAQRAAEEINRTLGYQAVKLNMEESYYNMESIIEAHKEVLTRIDEAYKKLGLTYEFEDIRGGTDGSRLSYLNMPCPNLGTGGYNFHGRYEYLDTFEMLEMVEVVKTLICLK